MQQQNKLRPDADSRPLSEIVAAVIQNLQNIFRTEVRLAGLELKEKARKSGKAAGLLGGAALLGFFATACFIATCIVALSIVLPVWLSTLLMGVTLAFGAGGAFLLGRLALQDVEPIPQQTLETLKDNIDWAKTRAR